MERFTGVLIEHFAGNFPTWLAPEQVRVLPMNDDCMAFAQKAEATLKAAKVRVTIDRRQDKLGAKIRHAELDKVPHMLVIGRREAEQGQVTLRSRIHKSLEGTDTLEAFVSKLLELIATKALPESMA
jgi:threonyl-tRNA synthetase